jgi:hypothetical protein
VGRIVQFVQHHPAVCTGLLSALLSGHRRVCRGWIARRDAATTCGERWCPSVSSRGTRNHADIAPPEPTDLAVTSEMWWQADSGAPRRRGQSRALCGGFPGASPACGPLRRAARGVAVSVAVRRGIRHTDALGQAAVGPDADRPHKGSRRGNLRIYSGIRGVLNLPLW